MKRITITYREPAEYDCCLFDNVKGFIIDQDFVILTLTSSSVYISIVAIKYMDILDKN